uniref:Uncharacterized protein n=1 Tax=Oryza nivara TaxID=4536 RepID=A0A0E0JA83_ORYNI
MNAPFILDLDCDYYVNNSQALRAGICFMIERGGGGAAEDAGAVAFVQFPQRVDGVDPGDRYANHNRVLFDCTELGLDGLQGPIYVGTGCLFRRVALYSVDLPRWRPRRSLGCRLLGEDERLWSRMKQMVILSGPSGSRGVCSSSFPFFLPSLSLLPCSAPRSAVVPAGDGWIPPAAAPGAVRSLPLSLPFAWCSSGDRIAGGGKAHS